MSNKNLLNESTIRKFMKLASIEPLADSFVSSRIQESEEELEEMNCGKVDDDKLEEADEELEEGYGKKEELDEAEEELEEAKDEDLDEEVDLDEMGMAYQDDEDMADMGADMDAEAGAGRMLDMDQFLQVLEKAVEEFLGEPTEVEYDAEAEMDMDMEAPEGEMEMDVDMEAEPMGDEEMGDEEEEEEEEDLAEAIYKQVLKRLSK